MSEKPKILLSESTGFSPAAADMLRQHGQIIFSDLDRKGLLSAVAHADILWVRLRHRIDSEVMAEAPRLRMIVSPTTGLNHIDLSEAARRGVSVLSLQGDTGFLRNIRATAEHTIGLILALLRHIPAASRHAKSGGWNRDSFQGIELHEKTVGIVGYGRLGQLVSRYLKPFDARILASDPHIEPASLPPDIQAVPMDVLLQQADLVTLHVSLGPETRGFFGQDQFMAMKKGAWFINTSRGELIDENALLGALKSKQISGAALDVLSNESFSGMKDHPLVVYAREHDDLIITPHIGGCTVQSMERTEEFMAHKLCARLTEMTHE